MGLTFKKLNNINNWGRGVNPHSIAPFYPHPSPTHMNSMDGLAHIDGVSTIYHVVSAQEGGQVMPGKE